MLSNEIMSYIRTQLKADSSHISDIIELSEGNSGAQVYRAKIISSSRNLSGIYIIKLINTNSMWFSPADNEEKRCKDLHGRAEKFRDRLVELVASETVGRQIVLLYRQANDSVLNSDTLDKLNWSEKAKYLELVSYELLSGMNVDFRQDGRGEKFFQEILKYRLEDDGNFYHAASETLEMPIAPAILVGTKVYPNPVYYIRHQDEWMPLCKDMVLMRGNMHGDLHGQNIICMKELTSPEDMQYSIIDYDSYESNGFLLFDQAYLELYLYTKMFPENDFDQWRDTLTPLLREGFQTSLKAGVGDYALCFRNAICGGIQRWQGETLPRMKDDLDIQFHLARIAAAANFFSKRAITDWGSRVKFLIYMGLCFETLFQKLSFSWQADGPSPLKSIAPPDYMDQLWKSCLRYAASYTPVLLTDDNCRVQDARQLTGLTLIDWRLVIDIGNISAPDDISTKVPAQMSSHRHVNLHIANGSGDLDVSVNDCEWIVCKKEDGAYRSLWLHHQQKIKKIWKSVRAFNRMKPYLFIFDIKEGQPFAQQFLHLMSENIDQLSASRFISLQELFSSDDITSFQEYQCVCENCGGASLLDLAVTAQTYFAARDTSGQPYITLPHLDSMQEPVLTEKELAHYETSVELVYSGIENDDNDCDFGASFYRGNEIKWRDIANRCDLELDERYGDWLQKLKRELIDCSPRIRRLKLVHGAGTGGTTLSKRILWDLKETTPTMRLLRYTKDTANILLEIYRKTGKILLLSVEMGSTVINQDELDALISAVDSENGKLWVLQVERSHITAADDEESDTETPFIELKDTLKHSIAKRFFDKFRQMTTDRHRHDFLNHITNLTQDFWLAQRCPFFYGFYTFQEEYNLDHIRRTVAACDRAVQELLSDMALMTVYSQNIGVPIHEAARRLLGSGEVSVVPALVLARMDSSVAKIIVHRESGLRICHTIIAREILKELYSVGEYGDCISAAAMGLIDRLYAIYGEEDENIDAVLRELFIDRAVVDNERMKFSFLIGDIGKINQKKAIFQKLIDYYPSNPHYLNHMARLLVFKDAADYTAATDLIDKAIDISDKDGVKIHYITKGCILSKKVFSRMDDIRNNTRQGRYAMNFKEIIDEISVDYSAAEEAFMAARESGLTSDSYTFFPYIDLECRLVEKLASCDRDGRSRQQLLKDDKTFCAYYMEHYGKAVELFDQMRTHCWDNAEDMLDSARKRLDSISMDEDRLAKKLEHWNTQTGRQAQFARRTYAAALYANQGYSWQNMRQHDLEEIERAMYLNLTQSVQRTVFQDIDFWFESYCRLKTFSSERAIDVIQDYMPDGYNKEFYLFILQFLRLEKGFATTQEVIRHSATCKGLTPGGINTSKAHMAYAENTVGCPIISMRYVQRGKYGEFTRLKEFQGSIINIRGSTSATILVDKIGLEAVFVPSVRAEDGTKREFTTKNLHDRVKFNLLFSYSGLRAWNIE